MPKRKKKEIISYFFVVLAAILAWLSGYFVMQMVYNSIAASVIFGTVWAVIVFCESRFSYISLKSDGRIEITKEEVKSNLWQIIAATLVALLVAIPLELKIFSGELAAVGSDLGTQIKALVCLFPSKWLPLSAFALLIVFVYQIPIFVRMASEE